MPPGWLTDCTNNTIQRVNIVKRREIQKIRDGRSQHSHAPGFEPVPSSINGPFSAQASPYSPVRLLHTHALLIRISQNRRVRTRSGGWDWLWHWCWRWHRDWDRCRGWDWDRYRGRDWLRGWDHDWDRYRDRLRGWDRVWHRDGDWNWLRCRCWSCYRYNQCCC